MVLGLPLPLPLPLPLSRIWFEESSSIETSLRFRGRIAELRALPLATVDGLPEDESVFMAGAADEAGEVLVACRIVPLQISASD